MRLLVLGAVFLLSGWLMWPSSSSLDDGRLVAEAEMSQGRAAHTMTPLADGQVLIVGGMTTERNRLADAERYNPASGQFEPTSPLLLQRQSHTATRLADGRVLIVGGYDAEGHSLNHAEIYDPSANTFTATGRMHTARASHVAVQLSDGRVMVMGGVGPNWTFLASAEVYDPATGRFTPTGAMTQARQSHVAVVLDTDEVLVFGGHQGRRSRIQLFTSVERYDPATATFAEVGHMQVRRHKHDAILLPDGSVLITGGADERDGRGQYTSVERYDPTTNTATLLGPMQRPRYKHHGTSVVLADGRVLLGGGHAQAEVYSPASGTSVLVPGAADMTGQFSATAQLPGGEVLITGGYGEGQGPQAKAWRYRLAEPDR